MKRVLTIQDLSCIGKCSLTVALPIISAMKVETAVLPTAVLSTHTAFNEFTYRDLTCDLYEIKDKWNKENFNFDSIYTGYLASDEQIEILKSYFKDFKTKNNFILVDPVMGDNGKLYSGFDIEFANKMKGLCSEADIIVPNLTEATAMLSIGYKETYDRNYIKDILVKLSDLGPQKVILTGISFSENEIGVISYDRETDVFFEYFKEKIDAKYHGTGDIFASTLVGAMVNNNNLESSLKLATDFVWETISETFKNKGKNAYGTDFENVLYKILKKY